MAGVARMLVVNAGSSSLKLRLLDAENAVVEALDLQNWDGSGEAEDLRRFLDDQPRIDAIGHRIVHGGTEFGTAAVIDADVRQRLAALTDLAPLHQPRGIAGVDALRKLLPDTPAVACFDTAFHATLPPAAATYALPRQWNRRWGLRRYGFHGLSHAYAAARAAELLGRPLDELRTITCHLGSGASLAAVDCGRSVDTTMGFTPLAGLVMATRTGSVDPGLVLWLQQHAGLDFDELSDALEHRSGLAGLTGGSGDLREVLRAADGGDGDAQLAFDVYVHRLRREIAAMAAALDRVDAVVFTGGVGEHSPRVRAAACRQSCPPLALDTERNQAAEGDADISTAGADTRVLVITAREDLQVAKHTRVALAGA